MGVMDWRFESDQEGSWALLCCHVYCLCEHVCDERCGVLNNWHYTALELWGVATGLWNLTTFLNFGLECRSADEPCRQAPPRPHRPRWTTHMDVSTRISHSEWSIASGEGKRRPVLYFMHKEASPFYLTNKRIIILGMRKPALNPLFKERVCMDSRWPHKGRSSATLTDINDRHIYLTSFSKTQTCDGLCV